MTGMGMTQLPTPDISAGRQSSSPADSRSDRKREDSSRFDDVARQQQKRLDAKADVRRQDRADARRENLADAGHQTDSAKARGAGDDQTARAEQGSVPKPEQATGEVDASKTSDDTDDEARIPPPDFAAMSFAMPAESESQAPHVLPSLQSAGLQPGNPGMPGLPASGLPGLALMAEGSSSGALASRELFISLQKTASGKSLPADGNFMELLKTPTAERQAGGAELSALTPASPPALRGAEPTLMRGYTTSVEVPVGAADWGEKVMGKLTWLTAAQMTVAEIHVTPPELGPLDVRVQVQNDQATVTVHASTPAVRDQLEAQSQRLRDMLAEQGFNLQGFDVTDSGTREQSAESQRQFAGNGNGAEPGDEDSGMEAMAQLDLSWKGEVDLYV